MKSTKRQPCTHCPWKKSTITADILGGGMSYTELQELDYRLHAMGCHENPEQPAFACAGFMVQVGFQSIGVRLAAAREIDHPENYTAGGAELYDSYDEMMAAHHEGVHR